ncbi:MAG: hypothetical protein KBT58_07940 [Bizionia sp.]|nr:hypothetical protein [Bizionia sp.]
MEEPVYRIEELKRIKSIARKLLVKRKDEGYKHPSTPRAVIAELLYPKLLLHLESVLVLMESETRIDFAALASVSRMIMEHHNVYYYLCGRGVTNHMFEFRYLLYDFHGSHETSRILRRLGFGDREDNHFGYFSGIKEWLENRLIEDPYFLSLNQKEKRRVITGKSAFFFSGDDKKHEAIPANIESGIYKLFSNSTHSYSLGVDMVLDGSELRHINTMSLLFLVIETCIVFASSMIKGYCTMRWKIAQNLSENDKNFIKTMTTSHSIGEWVEFRKSFRAQQLRKTTNC